MGAVLSARRLTRAAAIAGAVVSLAVWAEAVTNPVRDWDGRMTWVTQARYVRAEGSVDAAVLRGRQWYVTHPRYPLLLPLAQVAVLDLAGLPDDSHAFRALYAAFFPAFLLILHAGARRWAGPRAAALVVLAATLVPFLPFYAAGGAGGAYSDLPLACFYGAGLLLLLEPGLEPTAGAAVGLLLAGAALAKNEGALLAVWALALGGLARFLWRRRRDRRPAGAGDLAAHVARQRPAPLDSAGNRRAPGSWPARLVPLAPLAMAALPVALALALLASWRAGIPNRYDERYEEIASLGALLPNAVRRLPVVAPVVLRTMFSGRHWTLLWWVVPPVLWAGRRGLRHHLALPLALAALAPPAIAWGAYAVFPNPGFLAAVTWNRFLVQASIPGLLLLALALRGLLAGPLPAWAETTAVDASP
jgi:hypothetical protein